MDVFLKNTANIFNKGIYGIVVTYDVLFHQKLDELLIDNSNIILSSSQRLIFPEYIEGWLLLKNCYVENIIFYNNFVSYTIYFDGIEDMRSIYLQRKIKIKMLLDNKQEAENMI